ncbi:hypothetical protein Enr13x_48860 [Stieleria neptunia]|uniref:Uncharacterized protein n=1 Tax=Stieleria neptunia TaxID=2527979 RepID=A0A518HW15_9BACT|nr:hypothetical protein Enr13x_48860 [Stieleria neptunia]
MSITRKRVDFHFRRQILTESSVGLLQNQPLGSPMLSPPSKVTQLRKTSQQSQKDQLAWFPLFHGGSIHPNA